MRSGYAGSANCAQAERIRDVQAINRRFLRGSGGFFVLALLCGLCCVYLLPYPFEPQKGSGLSVDRRGCKQICPARRSAAAYVGYGLVLFL